MAGQGRLPPSPPTPGAGRVAGPPVGSSEEANPFSFKEFVRSKNQSTAAPTLVGPPKCAGKEYRGGSSLGPKEPPRFPLILDQEDSSPLESPGLNVGFQEPFFPDPTAVSSALEDEEEDEDWSSSYQPSAVEEVHSAGAPSTSTGSALDSFYGHPSSDWSDLQAFSPWQLGGGSPLIRSPLRRGDHSLPADGAAEGDGLCPPPPRSYEELKQENSKLRSRVDHLQAVSERRAQRVTQLERTLEESRRKEAREAQDLEAMVQQVEENLQRMTRDPVQGEDPPPPRESSNPLWEEPLSSTCPKKRATKAESCALKLKQENALLQVQVENYRLENEALRSRHLADLAVVKHNADVALHNLLTVVAKSRSSIKQLVSGAEALQLVAELLKSIDKVSEISQDSS
ncbi:hypothetical protein lerEdw1_009337 [Lerista edwardsae]|nr:hypothetical protein lerEdw1_009337 [Lerista edwardsae]